MGAVAQTAFRPFATPASRQQRRHPAAAPSARGGGYGSGGWGGSGGGSSNDPRNQRLILPGQESGGAARGGRLVMPGGGQQQGGGGAQGGGLSGPGLGGATQQNFRPPPGFMNREDANEVAPEVAGLPVDEMLNRLRSTSGHWYQLAKLLPALQRAGFDGVAVEEETGVERKLQNVWNTAAQVHDSIRAPGLLTPEALAHFDYEGEYLLYELRFLSIKQRAPAAQFIAENNLSPHESMVLARAIKDLERREGHKEGFSDTPGDALAYKYYRDAMECRRKEDVEACVRKGLQVAQTEDARARLGDLLGEGGGASEYSLPAAILTTLRLTREELGFRPLAVAGDLQTTSVAEVLSAPKVASEGVFGNFRVPPEGANYQWVALPSWSVLTLAGHPVALMVRNCAEVARIRDAAAAKTEDELKRLSNSGVVVVDIAAEDTAVYPNQYYLCADGAGQLDLTPGGETAGMRVLGPVLFLARPPSRDTPANTTSELMSI